MKGAGVGHAKQRITDGRFLGVTEDCGQYLADVLAEAGEEHWARDPELYCQASTRPGAKLPHAWRRYGVASRRHPLEKSVSGI